MKTMKFTGLVAFAALLFMASCEKDTKTPTTPATNTPANTAGPQPVMPSPSGNNLSGALVSLRMKYSMQPVGSPMPVDINSEMALAVFYTAAGGTTKADAGTVSVNAIDLEKQNDASYFKWANVGSTPSDLKFDDGSDWNISGGSDVQAFTYNHNIDFPDYKGTLPSSVTKSSGLELTFNSSTLTGADSVYVLVAAGDKSVLKSYKATAGKVSISASDLQSLPTVTDNTAFLEVCPFKYTEVVRNGKNYFFIKEQAVVTGININ